MKDVRGIEIYQGDVVVHAGRMGSTLWLTPKVVNWVEERRVHLTWEEDGKLHRSVVVSPTGQHTYLAVCKMEDE